MKIFKNLTKKESSLILLVVLTIIGDVYFELKMPEYTSALASLLQSGQAYMESVWYNGLRMLGCAFASTLCGMGTFACVTFISNGFEKNLRKKVFDKIIEYSDKEINKFSIASLITRTTNDISQLNMFLSMGLQMLIKAPTMAIWAIVKISNADLRWTYAVMICVGCILLSVIITAIICVPRFKIIQKLTDRLNNLTRENVSGVRVIRAFNAEEYQTNKFEEANNNFFKTQLFTSKVTAVLFPIITIGMNLLTIIIYWVGVIIINGYQESDMLIYRANVIGNMTAFTSYAMQIIMSFMLLSFTFLFLPRIIVSINRINEVLDTDVSLINGNNSTNNKKGTIKFNNVSFSYGNEDNDVLHDINFEVNSGETLAIIGATGSGKSTLVDLIPRFFDVRSGEILIDDINVKEYDLTTLRSKISFAFQKAALFKGDILSNVTYGSDNIDMDEANKALDVSRCDFFDGDLHYEVAQGATNLSGGQKQRLSIARALYKNSEIIIFDDTFSALDYKTDMLVRKGIKENYKDSTVIIIAQRIGTIKNADKIIVLDEGKIVGIGKHEELLKNCSVYKEIALSQLSLEEL